MPYDVYLNGRLIGVTTNPVIRLSQETRTREDDARMNDVIKNAFSSMMYFFLKICQGRDFSYHEEIDNWICCIEDEIKFGDDPNDPTIETIIDLLNTEMDEGEYWEDPFFMDKVEEALGGMEVPNFFEMISDSYLSCVKLHSTQDTSDGE